MQIDRCVCMFVFKKWFILYTAFKIHLAVFPHAIIFNAHTFSFVIIHSINIYLLPNINSWW